MKHAQADTLEVRFEKQNQHVHIVIHDGGVGFDLSILANGSQTRRGFGLFSIRERLAYMGGRFNIESAKGKGTRVHLIAPLESLKEGP